MQYFTGFITIKLLIQHHMESISQWFHDSIRPRVLISIERVLLCWTISLWWLHFQCPNCSYSKRVFFTCKSKLCNRCSKPAADKRATRLLSRLPICISYYHLTFTIPDKLRGFFKEFRHLWALNLLFQASKTTLLDFFRWPVFLNSLSHFCHPYLLSWL